MAIVTTRPLVDSVRDAGGVARVATLVAQGHSRYRIAQALDAGRLGRIRRDWVAVLDADPLLVAAARRGVVLTCLTAAHRIGLWVPEVPPVLHVGASGRGRVAVEPGALVHWHRGLVPRHPDALVDPIENVLMTTAACPPYESALAVWESALNARLVDRLALLRLPWKGQARRLAEQALPWADSGLESPIIPRLRWLGLRIVAQAFVLGHRVDFLIGERLVLQIDGGHHVGRQRWSDNVHDAELLLRGYHVVRVGYRDIVEDWPRVQDLIMRAVAEGLHLAR